MYITDVTRKLRGNSYFNKNTSNVSVTQGIVGMSIYVFSL